MTQLYRFAMWGTLIIISVDFMIDHVRSGMYPALAMQRSLGGVKSHSEYSSENALQYQRNLEGLTGSGGSFGGDEAESMFAPSADMGAIGQNRLAQAPQAQLSKRTRWKAGEYDKNATVQTGPGLPRWGWHQVSIRFSGPVQRTQHLSLWLVGPKVNRVLAFARVLLLAMLLLCVLGFPGGFWPRALKQTVKTAAASLAVLLTSFMILGASPAFGQEQAPDTQAAEPTKPSTPELNALVKSSDPRATLLAELKMRLLEQPECAPNCASSPRLLVEATPSMLRLRFEVLAAAVAAVPLPGQAQHWVPDTVVLDGRPASALARDASGRLLLVVGAGAHQVVLQGALPARDTVQIGLPLRAHRVEVATLEGWTLDGLHEDGVADENLQLSRKGTNDRGSGTALQTGTLPPFVKVKREVLLGLTWSVETSVTRLTPTGGAVVLEVPLLSGESVTSSDVRVQNGRALVNMPAHATTVSWSSVLEAKSKIMLKAATGTPWVEEWQVDVSPMWHVQFEGIPAVHQQDSSGARLPHYRPWPSEHVTLTVERPESISGQTLTIDQSSLGVTPGKRNTDVTFTANMRSSRGALHTFTLPDDATLQNVSVNGVQQPIRQEGHRVSVPLAPGSQSVAMAWQQPSGFTTSWQSPGLDVGTSMVNAELQVTVPNDRWVLFVRGPRMGPAVLFWSFLLVLLLVSFALGRLTWAPLTARQWVLLSLGLSQVPVVAIGWVFGWLLLLGFRRERPALPRGWFNLRQLAIVGATAVALIIIAASVYQGLLGHPEMQIQGNGSSTGLLRWFQDRTLAAFPQAWVWSLPMTVYRLAMLAWSLWMSVALLRWLTWGWQSFATGGLWSSTQPKAGASKP